MLAVGPDMLDDGELVTVQFELPGTGEIVSVDCSARWHRLAHQRKGAIGLRFESLNSYAQTIISAYVAELGQHP